MVAVYSLETGCLHTFLPRETATNARLRYRFITQELEARPRCSTYTAAWCVRPTAHTPDTAAQFAQVLRDRETDGRSYRVKATPNGRFVIEIVDDQGAFKTVV